MKKADSFKLLIIIGISLITFLFGCVDTNVTNIPTTIDYRSEVSLVNLVAGMGAANVTMKEASGASVTGGESIDFGSIALGDASPTNSFKDIPAGSKTAFVTYAGASAIDTIKGISTTSNYKMRLFLVGDQNSSRSIVSMSQRYISSTKDDTVLYPKGVAQVAFINGSPDDSVSAVDVAAGTDTSSVSFASPLGMGDIEAYSSMDPGDYSFFVVSQSGAVAQQNVTLAAQSRYTVIIYDYSNSLKIKILTDD